jgi:hypothetical protein
MNGHDLIAKLLDLTAEELYRPVWRGDADWPREITEIDVCPCTPIDSSDPIPVIYLG